MDPNAVLVELRAACSDYEETRGDGETCAGIDAADRMRDAAVALDQWLSKGGFLPSDWQR